MMNFDPECFVQQLMQDLQSLDFTQWVEEPLDRALDEMNEVAEENAFRPIVISFVQSFHRHLPNSLVLSDAHAWELANRMLELTYPCEGSPGSTAAYLDFVSGGICTTEHLYSAVSCGLKQHLQNQYLQAVLSEHLVELSFSKRLAIAHFLHPRYEQLGISIPVHHLAHSLESVLMQVFECAIAVQIMLPTPPY